MAPRRPLRQLLRECLQHRVPAGLELGAHVNQVRLEEAPRDELVQHRLVEQRRPDVGRGRERFERLDHLGRHDQVAHAQPGRPRLGERGREDDALAGCELVHAGQRLALVAHEPVRVVLEEEHAPRPAELHERVPLVERQRPAGRVLEGRDRVDELRHLGLREDRLEAIEVEAVVGQRNPFDRRAEAAQHADRAVVARGFDHGPAGIRVHEPGDEVEAEERAGRDDDLRRVGRAVLLCDPLAQRPVARRRPVVEDRATLAGDDGLCALAERVDRKDVGGRIAAGEGDHVHRSHPTRDGRRRSASVDLASPPRSRPASRPLPSG